MKRIRLVPSRAQAAALLPASALLLALSGCDIKHPTDDLVHGKQLFVAKCGACHVLAHAGTSGTVGPNLDAAYLQSHADGLKRNDYRGVVDFQIKYPNPYGGMPGMLYSGSQAADVAGYVAAVAAAPGQDTGALATAVQTVTQKPATEVNGVLQIDADPTGQLKYTASSATAKTGSVTLKMANKSSVPHDIAVTGNGVNAVSSIVQNGGTATVTVKLPPGKYTFYCTVPGHKDAGMQGPLVVK